MLKQIVVLWLLAIVVCGCRSDIYYQNRAVERARKFLLENCRELSVEESQFIRYNTPVLLHSPLLGGAAKGPSKEHLNSQLSQICVAWMVPGRKELVMVFGVSRAKMDFWEPNRVLIRDYSSHVPVLNTVIGSARSYVQDNYSLDMSAREFNVVRFSYPSLLRTDFELNFDVQGKKSDTEIAAALDEAAEKVQYSLVWKVSENKNMVLVGLADHKFGSWSVSLAEFMDDKALNEHTLAVILTPAEGLNAMPDSELDKLAGWEE